MAVAVTVGDRQRPLPPLHRQPAWATPHHLSTVPHRTLPHPTLPYSTLIRVDPLAEAHACRVLLRQSFRAWLKRLLPKLLPKWHVQNLLRFWHRQVEVRRQARAADEKAAALCEQKTAAKLGEAIGRLRQYCVDRRRARQQRQALKLATFRSGLETTRSDLTDGVADGYAYDTDAIDPGVADEGDGNWIACDDGHGNTYYFNEATQESSWEPPVLPASDTASDTVIETTEATDAATDAEAATGTIQISDWEAWQAQSLSQIRTYGHTHPHAACEMTRSQERAEAQALVANAHPDGTRLQPPPFMLRTRVSAALAHWHHRARARTNQRKVEAARERWLTVTALRAWDHFEIERRFERHHDYHYRHYHHHYRRRHYYDHLQSQPPPSSSPTHPTPRRVCRKCRWRTERRAWWRWRQFVQTRRLCRSFLRTIARAYYVARVREAEADRHFVDAAHRRVVRRLNARLGIRRRFLLVARRRRRQELVLLTSAWMQASATAARNTQQHRARALAHHIMALRRRHFDRWVRGAVVRSALRRVRVTFARVHAHGLLRRWADFAWRQGELRAHAKQLQAGANARRGRDALEHWRATAARYHAAAAKGTAVAKHLREQRIQRAMQKWWTLSTLSLWCKRWANARALSYCRPRFQHWKAVLEDYHETMRHGVDTWRCRRQARALLELRAHVAAGRARRKRMRLGASHKRRIDLSRHFARWSYSALALVSQRQRVVLEDHCNQRAVSTALGIWWSAVQRRRQRETQTKAAVRTRFERACAHLVHACASLLRLRTPSVTFTPTDRSRSTSRARGSTPPSGPSMNTDRRGGVKRRPTVITIVSSCVARSPSFTRTASSCPAGPFTPPRWPTSPWTSSGWMRAGGYSARTVSMRCGGGRSRPTPRGTCRACTSARPWGGGCATLSDGKPSCAALSWWPTGTAM